MEESSFKSGFVTDFVDAKDVEDKVMALAKEYPDLVSIVTREDKTSGYDGKVENLRGPAALRYMSLGNEKVSRSDKPGVLLAAAPHAREVMQPMIMLEVAQQLLANYDPKSDDPAVKEITGLMDSTDIHVVPVSNPDGLNYALYDDPNWRKTRCKVPDSEHLGVDCNRNYDYRWIQKEPKENSYGGPHPFSEPETRNVAQIVDEHPNIKFVCDFHSRGNQIRRPMSIEDKDDLAFFISIQDRLYKAIKNTTGREYDRIESRVVNGASDDYFYFTKSAFAFVLENGSKEKPYKPPLAEALEIVKECSEAAKEFLRIAKDYSNS